MDLIKPQPISINATRPLGGGVVYSEAPAGMSIAEIIWNGSMPERLPYTLEVWVDGKLIPANDYDIFRPPPGAVLTINALPRGPNPLRTVLSIIVVIIAAVVSYGIATGPAIAGLGPAGMAGLGAAAGTVISGVGMLIVNAICPPKVPTLTTPETSAQEAPTLWIQGSRNRMNHWGTIPMNLGENRVVPFFGVKPYTEIKGNDQYFRGLYVIGYGPQRIRNIKIGDTPIEEYDEIEVEVRSGYPSDDPITLITNDVSETPLSVLLTEGVWETQYTEEEVDEFSIDWAFMSGLCYYDDNGTRDPWNVLLDGRYRKVGDVDWISFGTNMAIHAKTLTIQPAWNYVSNWYAENEYWEQTPKATRALVLIDIEGNLRVKYPENLVDEDPTYSELSMPLARIHILGDEIISIDDLRVIPDPIVSGLGVTQIAPAFDGDMRVAVAAGVLLSEKRLRTRAASSQPVRRSIKVRVAERGQYEVQMTRVTPENNNNPQIADQVTWIALRSIKNTPPISSTFLAKKPLAMIAVRAKVTEELNGIIDELNCVATSVCMDYDRATETWKMKPTSSPAALYRLALQGKANAKPLAIAKIDLDWLVTFWKWCANKKYFYNAIVSTPKSVYEQCATILSVARAVPQRIDGKWAGFIDREQTLIKGHYGPHNSWGFEFWGTYPDPPHAWRVAFRDASANWEPKEHIVYADGYSVANATLFEAVDQEGITDANHIFRQWRYHHAVIKLRWAPMSFYVDWEHLANKRGDLVRCTYYEIMGQVFDGRVKSIVAEDTSHRVTLDRQVLMETDKSYCIRFRLNDGSSVVKSVTTEAGWQSTALISGAGSNPAQGDYFQFGELDAESIPALIKSIEPVDKLCAKVTVVDYSPEVFNCDTEAVPEWDPVFTDPTFLPPRAPRVPIVVAVVSDESVMKRDPGGRFRFQIAVNFRAPSAKDTQTEAVRARFRRTVDSETDVPPWEMIAPVPKETGVIYIPNVEEGKTYEFQLQALSKVGQASTWGTLTSETVVGRTSNPGQVQNLAYSFTKRGVLFTWDLLSVEDIKHYKLTVNGQTFRIQSDQYEWEWQAAGIYTASIVAVDVLNNVSETATEIIVNIEAPKKVTNLRAQVLQNFVLLYWDINPGSFTIAHSRISKGGVLLGTAGGTFHSFFEDEAGVYTYSVASVDTAGNIGASKSITLTVDNPRGYRLISDMMFIITAGILTNAYWDAPTAQLLLPVNTTETFQDNYTNGSWATLQEKIDDGYNFWLQPSLTSGEWKQTVDMTVVLPSTRVSVVLNQTEYVSGAAIRVFIAVSADNIDWTDETEAASVYKSAFRYIRVRVVVEPTLDTQFIGIETIQLKLDVTTTTDGGMMTTSTRKVPKYVRASGIYSTIPAAAFPNTAGVTLEWRSKANFYSLADSYERMFSTQHSSGGAYEIRTYASNKSLRIVMPDGTTTHTVIFGILTDGTDYRFSVAWTYDPGTGNTVCKAYVDGVLKDTTTWAGQVPVPDQMIELGRYNTVYFEGQIYDFRIWNIERTQAAIQADMNSELVGNESNLVGYWKCTEGTGTNLNDSTANNRDGTLSSASWEANGVLAPFNANFLSIDNVNVSLEGINPASPMYEIAGDLRGLYLYAFDSAGALVVRTISWSVTGILEVE